MAKMVYKFWCAEHGLQHSFPTDTSSTTEVNATEIVLRAFPKECKEEVEKTRPSVIAGQLPVKFKEACGRKLRTEEVEEKP